MKKIFTVTVLSALFITGCNQAVPSTIDSSSESKQTTVSVKVTSGTSSQQSTEGKKANLITKEVSYYVGHDKVKGYLVMPVGAENLPAVVLVHEWWGLNNYMRDMATAFATRGYVALAVDLYDGQIATVPDEAKKMASQVSENAEEADKNLQAAVDYLKNMKEVNKDRVASVGWCFGGGWAYEMAKNNMGVKATVMYYGQFGHDDLSHMKATIIGHFGEKDTNIKVDNVKEFQAALKTQNGNNEVYIYPNAGHGFANPSGANYNEEAADLAWQRTMDFLQKNL